MCRNVFQKTNTRSKINYMILQVTAIQFSQGENQGAASALKLRKNAFQTLPPVEWIRDINTRLEPSMVAYAISQVRAHSRRVVVRVKFKVSQASTLPASISIRAMQPPLNIGPNLWSTLLLNNISILGDVKEQTIPIAQNGETPFISFELKNHTLDTWGVGIFESFWNWQFREKPHQPWESFDKTQHRVYILLNEPTLPFSQDFPGDALLPWTDILDYACDWAAGSRTEDEATGRITGRLFSMGPTFLEYNCVNFLPAYVQTLDLSGNSFFNCTNFLLHLKTNNINRFIICSDCAAIVSTFANIVGCDLWQSKMETPGLMFRVNDILAIGGFGWQTPCGVPGFAYHEVAWKGNCTSADRIFDACLAVDGSFSLSDPIRVPLLPVNMLLGSQGSGQYRDRLVFPPDWQLSEPRPQTRLRRMLIPGIPGFPFFAVRDDSADVQEKESLASVKQQFGLPEKSKASMRTAASQIRDFFIDKSAFPDWEIVVQDLFEGNEDIRRIMHTRWVPVNNIRSTLRVDFYECPSAQDAQEFALKILTTVHVGTSNVSKDMSIGDTAYSWNLHKNILFTTYNLVVVISNTNRTQIPVKPLAEQLDGYIMGFNQAIAAPATPGERRTMNVKAIPPMAEEAVNRWRL